MRALLSIGVIALAAALASPASAQMCGGGATQAQAGGSSGAGMCGMMGAAAAPAAGQQAQAPMAGGCGCCARMAMMPNMPMQGAPGGQDTTGQGQDAMPGMRMPMQEGETSPGAEPSRQ